MLEQMAEVTENTINSLVAEYMRHRDLQITTEMTGQTSYGRRQPDFVLRNSGLIFGEGEWEKSFMKGLKQAHDFSDLPGAVGSFVLTYPDKMKEVISRKLKDSTSPESLLQGFRYRGFLLIKGARAELLDGEIADVADWLRDGILHRPRKENAGAFVKLMRNIVEELSEYLPSADKYPSFFEHIIASMPKHSEEQETAKRAAAYLLLNQLVFYRILSQHKYQKLEPERLEQPGDLHSIFFEKVLEDNYSAIFSSNVASLFPGRSLPFIRDMITYINAVQPESFTRDLLGNIFHELIPHEVRKSVAAFYTNPEAARLLAKLTIDNPRSTVADFACGSGTLLMAAYDRKAELLRNETTEEDHKRFLEEEITGCDIMAFAAHLAVVQLALRQPSFLTDKVRIAVQDSTTLKPGMIISPLQSSMPQGQTELHIFEGDNLKNHKIHKGAISGQGKGHSFKLEKLDATLMNPPFTRKQLIGKEYRKLLTSRFNDYLEYESKEQSFFGYFVFLADRFLKPGGRMGFVLPATSIRQGSSEGMRQLIRDHYDLEYLILSGHRMAFSEDASFSEILLIAKKRGVRSKPRPNFVVATVKSQPTLDNMSRFVEQLKDASGAIDSGNMANDLHISPEVDFRIASVDELKASDWLSLLPGEGTTGIDLSGNHSFIPLVEIIGSNGIIQGIRFEGSSDYVNVKNTLISHRKEMTSRLNWEIIEEKGIKVKVRSQTTGAEVDIPRTALEPAIRSPVGMQTMMINAPPDYAVKNRFTGDESFWDDQSPDRILRKRIPHFKSREGLLLLAGRNHVGVVSENTHFLAFCSNEPLIPTWSFWTIKVQNSEHAKILCLWLNSIFAMTHLYDKRITGTGAYIGWLKSDLLSLQVPNIPNLPLKSRQRLLSLFNELGNKPFPSLISQLKDYTPARYELDITLAKELGLTEFENKQKLTQLYDLIAEKFERMDKVHSG